MCGWVLGSWVWGLGFGVWGGEGRWELGVRSLEFGVWGSELGLILRGAKKASRGEREAGRGGPFT
jgi:hypothetical protein